MLLSCNSGYSLPMTLVTSNESYLSRDPEYIKGCLCVVPLLAACCLRLLVRCGMAGSGCVSIAEGAILKREFAMMLRLKCEMSDLRNNEV
jgi:hypothetical protein